MPEPRLTPEQIAEASQRLDGEQAYVYVNVLRAYRQLLDDSAAWVKEHDGGNVVRYLHSPESAGWSPLIDALIEQGAKELTIVNNNAGNGDTGLAALLKAKRVRKIICSFPRQTDSYVFDALYRAGEI